MNWDTVQQLVRIVMQLVAGWLAAQGWITADMVTALVGGVVSIAGVAWWAFWERTRPDAATAFKL
jgi:hypothetical protein